MDDVAVTEGFTLLFLVRDGARDAFILPGLGFQVFQDLLEFFRYFII